MLIYTKKFHYHPGVNAFSICSILYKKISQRYLGIDNPERRTLNKNSEPRTILLRGMETLKLWNARTLEL
jgi:hypothetical protein